MRVQTERTVSIAAVRGQSAALCVCRVAQSLQATTLKHAIVFFCSRIRIRSKKCWDSNGKVTIFAVKMGTDKSAFWKAFVRIACVKCDPSADNITSYKLINLRQFLTIFNTFQTHLEAMTSCEQQHDRVRPTYTDLPCTFCCCCCCFREPHAVFTL